MGPASNVTIRTARAREDWRAVRDLCCRTGHVGNPIERSRWPFFAELWVGPYQRVVPGWTFVADGNGSIVGYLTGCPDTRAFRRACRSAVTLPLLLRVARGRYGWNADTRRFVRRALRLERGPEERLLDKLPSRLYLDYPAHLHMNVDAPVRGRGIGRRLFEVYVENLQARGVPGVHLFCGSAATPFYQRLGFHELARVEFRPGVWVHALTFPPATTREALRVC